MSILDYAISTAWALDESVFAKMTAILVRHASGEKLSAEQIEVVLSEARAGQAQASGNYYLKDGTAVIPIYGVIAKHANQVGDISSPRGTSTKAVESDIRKALADPDVERILLDIESPGGSIDGVAALADAVRRANQEKPVFAFANDLMASAAYWIGSQARAIYATETALVGSIGVYSVLQDASRYAANLGIDVDIVRSAPLKGMADGAPILPEQRESIQAIVDRAHSLFVAAIAKGRGVPESKAAEWATGQAFTAERALELGLIDGIRSFSETLATTHGGRRVLASSQEVSMSEPQKDPAPSAEDVRAQDRARLASLKAAFPDDLPFAVAQWEAGHDVNAAKAEYLDVVQAQLADERKARETAEKKAEAKPEPKAVGVAPVRQGAGASAPTGFLERFEELKREGNSPDRAMSLAVAEDPERHMAFVRSRNTKAFAANQLEFLSDRCGARGEG